jgi:hypothetical protein
MDQRILRTGKAPRHGSDERGFTLVEVMMAGLVGVIALTANLAMFNYANRDFAYSRSLTEATNIATLAFADFKTKTIAEINNTTNLSASGLRIGTHTETTALLNCLPAADHYGIEFCRNWEVSNVDIDSDGTADMIGDLVKIKLTVNWTIGGRPHQITMTNMTTGKPS